MFIYAEMKRLENVLGTRAMHDPVLSPWYRQSLLGIVEFPHNNIASDFLAQTLAPGSIQLGCEFQAARALDRFHWDLKVRQGLGIRDASVGEHERS